MSKQIWRHWKIAKTLSYIRNSHQRLISSKQMFSRSDTSSAILMQKTQDSIEVVEKMEDAEIVIAYRVDVAQKPKTRTITRRAEGNDSAFLLPIITAVQGIPATGHPAGTGLPVSPEAPHRPVPDRGSLAVCTNVGEGRCYKNKNDGGRNAHRHLMKDSDGLSTASSSSYNSIIAERRPHASPDHFVGSKLPSRGRDKAVLYYDEKVGGWEKKPREQGGNSFQNPPSLIVSPSLPESGQQELRMPQQPSSSRYLMQPFSGSNRRESTMSTTSILTTSSNIEERKEQIRLEKLRNQRQKQKKADEDELRGQNKIKPPLKLLSLGSSIHNQKSYVWQFFVTS